MKNNIYKADNDTLIGNIPEALIKYSSILFVGLIMLFFIMSLIIKIPEKISANISISVINPPYYIYSKTNGKIIKLNYNTGDHIKSNEILFVIEKEDFTEDIYWLRENLSLFRTFFKNISTINQILYEKNHLKCSLNNSYQNFIIAFREYYLTVTDLTTSNKVKNLEAQLCIYDSLTVISQNQLYIQNQQVTIDKKHLERVIDLNNKKISSQKEVEDVLKLLNEQNATLQQLKSNKELNELNKNLIHTETQLLNDNDTRQLNNTFYKVLQSINQIESELYEWSLMYELYSPVDGIFSLNEIWSVNQQVVQNQKLASVTSLHQKSIGILKIPIYNAGKIKIGNEVLIKLDDFPFQKYGMIKSSINSISELPFDGFYLATVELVNPIITNYKKTLPIKPQISGLSEVIIENQSLFRILFEKLMLIKDS